jgi:hypothetical protein
LRNRAIGKFLLIVVLSILLGVWVAADSAADHAKGVGLTLEQYTAEYDMYRAGLMGSEVLGPWANIMICFLLLGGAFLAYEAIGSGLAWVVGKAWSVESANR